MRGVDVVRGRFESDTAEHKLSVLLDDGLYRHLRFAKPGTSIYRFDLVTWPGYLAIVGDAGDWVFARTADMLAFFVPEGREAQATVPVARVERLHAINPQYWSEKLVAPRPDGAETYSHEAYCERVVEWFRDASVDLTPSDRADLYTAVRDQLLAGDVHGEHEAHRALYDFEHAGRRIADTWDWGLREYRHDFLWCCFAIVWGITEYRRAVV